MQKLLLLSLALTNFKGQLVVSKPDKTLRVEIAQTQTNQEALAI